MFAVSALLCKWQSRRLSAVRYYQKFAPTVIFKDAVKPELQAGASLANAVSALVQRRIPDGDLPVKWPKVSNRFMTSPKTMIVNDVRLQLSRLRNDGFLDKSGNASRLIYGEKGIGKSSALTLAVMGSWLLYDDVIPIYVEYKGNPKEWETPGTLLCEAMGLSKRPLSDCLNHLHDTNRYAFIVADEIEQVYNGENEDGIRTDILYDLAELGTQRSGRTYTYLCGSSSITPALISKMPFIIQS
ncbi:MAG: hypothetical protein EOP48_01200 [Sphingobacteriales bacterium]|nr:MAG: hypothetical protein EOP48_01200 [Sphingobacteriales bacterium]